MTEIHIDQLIRSRRRTVTLEIDRHGKLTVRAPLRMRKADIQRLVSSKAAWIEAHQTTARTRLTQNPPPCFVPGELFWYLGERYPLQIVLSQQSALTFQGAFYMSASAQPRARQVFVDWYRQAARQVISQKLVLFASQHGFRYHALRITSARTRWGSCSTKGNLSFSWRLVMTPQTAIDYVVLHELVHLVEPNHSPRFWAQVAQIMPAYQEQRHWLRQNGHLFNF